MRNLTLLSVYAHPDDETSSAGGMMCRVMSEGGSVHAICATRGELGTLGTGGMKLTRDELPAVRERELRDVLRSYGVESEPVFLGYRDQELIRADIEDVEACVLEVMERVRPDVVATFGPLGISRHDDHIQVHHAARRAFFRYLGSAHGRPNEPRLWYTAIPVDLPSDFDFELDLTGPDADPNVFVDVADYWRRKAEGLRTYRSQEDAQEFATYLESHFFTSETFHQAHPPLPDGALLTL